MTSGVQGFETDGHAQLIPPYPICAHVIIRKQFIAVGNGGRRRIRVEVGKNSVDLRQEFVRRHASHGICRHNGHAFQAIIFDHAGAFQQG
eukprot:scaffold2907_cov161-Amphora_coffeaeformis.AAC.3